MMNDTMEVISTFAESLARRTLREDVEYQTYQDKQEALEQAFRARHGRNRALIDEVGELQDALCMIHYQESEFLFFLGLQMGLELGKIDLLGREVRR